jgi:hypothetical protein
MEEGRTMAKLRDFLYLDTVKLHSFVSQIHGGLVNEINETIKRHGGVSAGIDISIPTFGGGKIGTSKDKENERQQTMQVTNPAYFGALYQYLKDKSEIKDIAAGDLQTRQDLTEGQFVETTGIAEPPAVEHWIAQVRALVEFIDKNLKLFAQTQTKGQRRTSQSLSRKQMELFKGLVDFLEDYMQISRKDPGKQYIRVIQKESAYSVWCGLIPDFITTPLQAALPAEVHIVGRVERLLGEEVVYKIVDLSQFNQPADINKLLDALNALGPLIGQKQISETDLQAQYPDFFVTPIAIYR